VDKYTGRHTLIPKTGLTTAAAAGEVAAVTPAVGDVFVQVHAQSMKKLDAEPRKQGSLVTMYEIWNFLYLINLQLGLHFLVLQFGTR
jgi:hypothetical protein